MYLGKEPMIKSNMSNPTGQKSNSRLLEGDKLYIQRARKALPILVRQAKSGELITYSDLADELGMHNPRNLNYVLGAVGNALEALASNAKIKKLPVINSLVINKNSHLPGDGIDWFIEKEHYDELSISQKRELMKKLMVEIFTFTKWDWVLSELGLPPSKSKFKALRQKIKPPKSGSGESIEHRQFKEYIANRSSFFCLPYSVVGDIEHVFPSLDAIDVLFKHREIMVGVEVKSIISDTPDILRGLFQCVKYKALIEAEQKVNGLMPNCNVYLAMAGGFPPELFGIKNQLGIEVIDHLQAGFEINMGI